MYVDLNWDVINSPMTSCTPIYFNFKMLNNTAGGVVDTSVFSIINTTSGLQKIKVQTSSIPAAKLWSDIKIEARLQGDLVKTQIYSILITNKCAVTSIVPVAIDNQVYYHGRDAIDFTFLWTETVGTCGPISYFAKEYLSGTPSSNNSLDAGVFAYPKPSGGNNTLRIYTWDDTKAATYQVRVFASLGVGGYKQSNIIFTVQVIKDPCSYFPYQTSFVEDLTLWINQTNQIVNIPPFTMNDTSWICNFTYELRTSTGTVLDPIFITKEIANQGDGTNITLVTTDITKVELSPQGVRVRGWPKRQNQTSLQFFFRIFVAYQDKADCSSGKYYDSVSESCLACVAPCKSCKSATQCTWCISGYTYLESTQSCALTMALAECPTGTIRDPYLNQCRKCSDFCKTCTDSTTCTQCVTGYSLANGNCFQPRVCPEGFRYDETVGCVACPTGCAKCPSTGTCHFCLDTYYLDTTTGQCKQTCPKGTYADIASRVCMVCQPSCSACVGNNHTCTECKDVGLTQYYLFGSTCVTRCPYIGYFQNEANRSCDACNSQCKICVEGVGDCIVCNPGSVISGRECLNSCPEGYYITVIGTCFKCDNACLKCYGSQNSMCTQCVEGQYLTQTTCDSKCQAPLFPDGPSRSCKPCPYYCNSCTLASNCMKCKTGYKQEPQDCTGEYFLRTTSTQTLSVPLNPAKITEVFNPTSAAVELWFKADNIASLYLEIILGIAPYKFRKKANTAQVQLNWLDTNYCDSTNLKSNQWYHFAFSMSEDNGGSLYCYVDGKALSVGPAPVAALTANIEKFREITFGGSLEMKTSESKFNGYVKEFRWWKKPRSQFQIANFKNVALTDIGDFSPPNELLAYWKLDEKKTDVGGFKDFASNGALTFDPVSVGKSMSTLVEMREIYLKLCPEGSFVEYNDTLSYYVCTPCDADCQNCNGPTNTNCTSCVSPYKLLETEQKCIITADCPAGYWMDINKDCWPCHEFCTVCYGGDQYQCTGCKSGYFKAYKRAGCVDSCPRGLYGNYLTQSCAANPKVTSLYPEDGVLLQYGSFIDLEATFEVLNNEPRSTYTYGWMIHKLNSDQDVAKDATKRYAGTDILKVHLDNNIVEPNNYYNITFYVKGDDTVYNGMRGSMFNVIYIGIPPKGGVCQITPVQGIATVTEFTLSTGRWQDPDGISEFRFLYSLDDGQTFLPVPSSAGYTKSSLKFSFGPVFKITNAKLRCQVKSLKGFYASTDTSFLLAKKSTASSKVELQKFTLNGVTSESQSLGSQFQLYSIASDIGSLKKPDHSIFSPKVSPDQCTEELCSFSGQCVFQPFDKRYLCKCEGGRAGRNCTFKNITELETMRNLSLGNAKLFAQKSNGAYDTEYLLLASSQMDLMTDDLLDKVHDLLYSKVIHQGAAHSIDLSQASYAMQVASNMLEYLDYNTLMENVTGAWSNGTTEEAFLEKQARANENFDRTLRIAQMIQNSTIYQLGILQTQISIQTRMLTYRQVIVNSDQILTMPASNAGKKQKQTFVKLSPANFLNTSVNVGDQYIAEAVEYSINPFQRGNDDRVASNIFEVNLYSQNKTVIENVINKIPVENLTTPIEIYFPASNNQNLTEFLAQYNALSPFRYAERKKREEMVVKSGLSCVYWDLQNAQWSSRGCFLSGLDSTHVKCACNHLSSFTITFTTPRMTTDAPLLENSTIKADTERKKTLKVSDIIRWPLSAYLANLQELWQHSRPSFLSFVIKPGFIVLCLFWSMYLSSLIYYSGRDHLKRDRMTKSQNREDLAELKDDDVQNLHQVIRDLIVRDFLHDHGRYLAKEARRAKNRGDDSTKMMPAPPMIKIYDQLTKQEQKKYRQRARRKVFGVPGGLWARATRFYDAIMKENKVNPNAKVRFFNEELKNNLWIGLIAKTSKIAPRHVRLALMYFYSSLQITILTLVFAFGFQEYITDVALFQVVILAFACQIGVWVITIPVALIFRMPLSLRKKIAGVRTKKINKAFNEIDKHMGCRYAIGYFICLTANFLMTAFILVFNMFYPHDYVMGWTFNIILIYVFDLVVFTFGIAALQLGNAMISGKFKCWANVWKAIEVFRYVKNLRG